MPYLRVSRDRHGYETTALVHSPAPGARPRILYLYRTAPGVAIGRPALDEEAIRTIEEQHPDIDFDWPHILEVGATIVSEAIERRQPRRKRKPHSDDVHAPVAAVPPEALLEQGELPVLPAGHLEAAGADAEVDAEPERELPQPVTTLLDELVGREIATRLRARYAELSARLAGSDVPALAREAFKVRIDALNPDTWVTPDEILSGVNRADAAFEAIRDELLGRSN